MLLGAPDHTLPVDGAVDDGVGLVVDDSPVGVMNRFHTVHPVVDCALPHSKHQTHLLVRTFRDMLSVCATLPMHNTLHVSSSGPPSAGNWNLHLLASHSFVTLFSLLFTAHLTVVNSVKFSTAYSIITRSPATTVSSVVFTGYVMRAQTLASPLPPPSPPPPSPPPIPPIPNGIYM